MYIITVTVLEGEEQHKDELVFDPCNPFRCFDLKQAEEMLQGLQASTPSYCQYKIWYCTPVNTGGVDKT